jgi:hypothetical protein
MGKTLPALAIGDSLLIRDKDSSQSGHETLWSFVSRCYGVWLNIKVYSVALRDGDQGTVSAVIPRSVSKIFHIGSRQGVAQYERIESSSLHDADRLVYILSDYNGEPRQTKELSAI